MLMVGGPVLDSKMTALVLTDGGNIDNLKVKDIEIPRIKEDELLVKVHATGLNPSDYQTAEFLQEQNINMVLGLDVVGEIVEIGASANTSFKVGERVMFLREISNPHGGLAQYATTPAANAIKLPDNVSDEDAATLPGAGMTAYHVMMQRFHLYPNRNILIQAGAGGVGSFAIQIAKTHGLKVSTTVKHDDIHYVTSLGADNVINYQDDDIWRHVNHLTDNHGFDYIVSSIGSEAATKDLKILANNGELACLQGLPNFKGWSFYQKGITVHEIMFGGLVSSSRESDKQEALSAGKGILELLANGVIHAPKINNINLNDVPSALKMMKNGKISGKVIVNL